MKLLLDAFPSPARAKELTDLGVERYYTIYQDIADPNAKARGVADPPAVIEWCMRSDIPRDCRWLVFDYEDPFGEMLARPHQDPARKAASASLVNLCNGARSFYPQAKASFFGYPGLNQSTLLDSADAESVVRDAYSQYADALATQTWWTPCIYDTMDALPLWKQIRYRRARSLTPSGRGPVTPMCCMHRAPEFFGDPEEHEMITIERFIAVQGNIARTAGGVALWSACDHYTEVACLHDPSGLQAQLRRQYQKGFNLNDFFWNRPAPALEKLRDLVHERFLAMFRAIIQ